MAENHPKRRAFEFQKKPRRQQEEPRRKRTERQIAADKRRQAERAAEGFKKHSGEKTPERRMAAANGRVRITGLIVDELSRALKVILKFDGPADVLMKLFFKSNPQLGMRDRGLIAEGIYDALRRYGTLRAAMRPVHPDRAPRLAALTVLALSLIHI